MERRLIEEIGSRQGLEIQVKDLRQCLKNNESQMFEQQKMIDRLVAALQTIGKQQGERGPLGPRGPVGATGPPGKGPAYFAIQPHGK